MNVKSITKVLLVDDHALIRQGVQSMLEQFDDLEVIASVASGEDAINSVNEQKPDVILMDIMMSGMTGIEATRWIKENYPDIKVVMLSAEISKTYVSASIQSGVDGYLPKDVDSGTLIEAIRVTSAGGRYFNDAIMKLVFEDFFQKEKVKAPAKSLPNNLTAREYEVLQLIALGKSNKELAEELFISIKTVETHKTNILQKLGLKNTAEVVRYAIKNKIIDVQNF
ncbi:MAG: response regulator transcription factor [Cyclobacteriaceae bacterium]|nr:response regulator transcription factor [Cyclobacteriaceae bacterium]MBX2958298.1 response regulator transcription factor [Cyclobacteriaceae bacterium]